MDHKNIYPTPEHLAKIQYLYDLRNRYYSHYFWKVRSKVNDCLNDNKNPIHGLIKDLNGFRNILFDSFTKLDAMYYHYKKLIEEETSFLSESSELRKSMMNGGASILEYEPITYELESFLASSQSALDIYSNALAFIFKNKAKRFSSLESICSSVLKSKHKLLSDIASNILQKIKDNKYKEIISQFMKKGVVGQKTLRDYSIHYGTIPHGQIVVSQGSDIIRRTYLRKGDYKSQFQIEEYQEYAENTLYLIYDFVIDSLVVIFQESFEHGLKMSVLDHKCNK